MVNTLETREALGNPVRGDALTAKAIHLLDKLVSFPTVSSDSNLALIEYVRDYLYGYGIDSRLIPSACGHKANLLASIGPNTPGGVVLSGHTDVVPVDGQAWESDPFVLTRRDNRLYGRGAADMKGFLAVVLAHVPEFLHARLARPFHLAFSYDEEIGCLGAPAMIEVIAKELPPAFAAIVGEPTKMKTVTAHKGMTVCRTTIGGVEAHSSLGHLGVSAVEIAAQVVARIARFQREHVDSAAPDNAFEPNHTTISVNQINGGSAPNILARNCWFVWDVRNVPSDQADTLVRSLLETVERDVIAPIRRRFDRVSISNEVLARVPAMHDAVKNDAELLVNAILGSKGRRAVPYAAEAGQFQQAGLSTVILGPGSIEQAHQPDEFIEVSELEACSKFIAALTSHMS